MTMTGATLYVGRTKAKPGIGAAAICLATIRPGSIAYDLRALSQFHAFSGIIWTSLARFTHPKGVDGVSSSPIKPKVAHACIASSVRDHKRSKRAALLCRYLATVAGILGLKNTCRANAASSNSLIFNGFAQDKPVCTRISCKTDRFHIKKFIPSLAAICINAP